MEKGMTCNHRTMELIFSWNEIGSISLQIFLIYTFHLRVEESSLLRTTRHGECQLFFSMATSTAFSDAFYNKNKHSFGTWFSDREHAVLDSIGCSNHHVRAFTKKTLPRRLHYGGSRRIESLMLDLDPGYALVEDDTDWCMKGRHGWDPIHRSMNVSERFE